MAKLQKFTHDYEHEQIPAKAVIPCEICGQSRMMQDMVSLAAVYRMPGEHSELQGAKLPAYQCPALQHFGCCHEHALLALLHCIFEHIHYGPHESSGDPLQHDKLQRIADILEEPYD